MEEKKYLQWTYLRGGSPKVCIKNPVYGRGPHGEQWLLEGGLSVTFTGGRLALPEDHPQIDLIREKLALNPFVAELSAPPKAAPPETVIVRPKGDGLPETAPGIKSEAPPVLTTRGFTAKDILGD